MSNIPIEVNTGETKTITFHTAGTFNTEDIVFSISAAGGDANTTLSGVAYCNTAASTAAKKATMPGFELVTGQRIFLQTTNTNSAKSNVTLSVNDTEAKPIKIGTSNPSSSNFPAAWWIANYDGTNWVLTRIYLSDENTDTSVTQSATTTGNYRKILLGYNSSATTGAAITSTTNVAYEAVDVEVQPSTGKILSNGFVKNGGTSSQFLKADGSVDNNTYSLSSHDHSGVYKPIQTAVSSPTASTTTSTTFIDTVSQDTNGVINATKKTLPAYLSAVSALSATPSASLLSNTLTFKQFSQATSAQVSAADSSTKLYFNTAPTATNKIATMSDVNSAFQANDAMVFKGTLGTNGTVTALPATHYQGWTYKVITAGTWAGATCEVGDMIICITDGTSANNAHWTVVQSNIDGVVTGPASSTSGNVVTFNGTTGKLIKDSGFTIEKSVPSDAKFTDTMVTSSDNHYLPSTVSGEDKTASASGATAEWNIDVVKGVTLNTDGKGHVTGISVTSGKIPDNPNTDTKVTQTVTASSNSSWRPLIIGGSFSDATTFAPSTTTTTTYATHLAKFKPSTGVLGIVGLNKMNTNGTVADGSNNKLWNTNGGTTTIATVATSGSYSDLSNKPTIPTMMSELTNDVGYTDNTGTVTSVKVGTTSYNPSSGVVSLPAYPTNTDTTVTDADHHYSPSTVSGEDKTATASGATAAWSIDVVKGVTLNTDGKGHVTGISVTSGKIPANPNTDTEVTQTYASASSYANWRPLVIGHDNDSHEGFTPSTTTDTTYTFSTLTCQPSSGTIRANHFKVIDGTSSQFLKADGSVDNNTYSLSSHNHSGVYKPIQTAVSDPTATSDTSNTFIDTISQDANGVITPTKKNIPQDMVVIGTGASTKAKTATVPWTYTLKTGNVFMVVLKTSSTVAAATLSINGTAAKPVYIDGAAATASNWTSGTYLCYYNGTNYYMYTNRSPFQDTDTKVTPVALSSTETKDYNILLAYSNTTPTTNGQPNYATTAKINGKGEITATKFKLSSGTGFLKADGSVDNNTYSLSSHNHSGVYKPIQTAVSDPSVPTSGITTSTTFIDTISQDTNGVINATKKTLPTASTETAGIIKIGTTATTAAAGNHTHSFSDLSNTPAIPTMMSELTNDVGFTTNTGTVTSVIVGTTPYSPSNGVVSLPEYPTDIKVTQTYASASGYANWRPLVIGYSNSSTEGFTPSTATNTTYTFSTLTCQPSTGTIRAKSFKVIDGLSSQFLKADGSVDSTSYVTSDTKASSVVVGPTSSTDVNTDSTGSCFVNVVNSDNSVATGVKIIGSGSVSVNSSHDGIITITGTSSSHTHGNIQNDGTLQTTDVTIANGDKLVVTDASDSSKVARTSIAFDGSTTTQFLSKKGTWETVQGGSGSLPSSIPSSWLGNTATTAAAGNHTHNNYISSIKAVATDGVDGSENAQSTSNVYLNIVSTNGDDTTTVLSSNKISGSGTVSVSSNSEGDITITGTGGSGGADVTIPDSNITIGTTAKTYITVNSTSRSIKLPTKPPSGWLGTSSDTASKGNHTHGSITQGGYIKGNDVQSGGVSNDQVQIANGDRIVIGDFSGRSSNIYHPLKLTSIAFDGITATQFLSKKGTWETPITPLATPVATDEDDGIGMEGSVLPVDSISGISGIVGTKYEISQNFNVAILRPDTTHGGIAYLLPICMDESGHLFLPISESFSNILVNNGYVTSYLDNI